MISASVMKCFRGYVYVYLTGYAPERFLNLCSNRNILIWNLTPKENGYCFCISVEGYRNLKPILKKTRTKAKILDKRGLPFTMFRYRKRKIFCLGILAFSGLLYALSCFIWNIEVNGNSYLSEETILNFLKEKHATFGTAIRTIDCASLEEKMRIEYPEVTWASIKIYGTKMTVDIQESLISDVKDNNRTEKSVAELATDGAYDIIAARDGVITEMVTRAGTPLVSAGTSVTRGDILVQGRLDIYNDDGTIANYIYTTSDADITALVEYEYYDEINLKYQDKIKTGNVEKDYRFGIFGTILSNPFFQCPYENYNICTKENQLHFTDNFYVPIYWYTDCYEEYEIKELEYTNDEVKRLAEEHLLQYLTNLEEKGIQILEKNVMIEKNYQRYEIKGTIKAYESIVSFQPTEILEMNIEERQQVNEFN